VVSNSFNKTVKSECFTLYSKLLSF